MPAVKEQEKPRTTGAARKPELTLHHFDAGGAEVKTRESAMVTPQAATTTVTLTLHNGAVTFEMEVQVNPNSYPFVVTGGTITAGICGAPWAITGGHLGNDVRLDAKRQGSGSCANTITVVGEFQNPASYRGTYGFNGASSSFKHTTIQHC